ncbi:MAG TPA: DUF2272 domain-containing protein [Roseomonas sp.]|jgi:hypothetical protein
MDASDGPYAVMRGVVAAILLALAGCAVPPTAREPPLSYPPSARDRMIRIAIAEWEDWGRLTPETVPPRAEGQTANFPRVMAYWRALDPGADAGAIALNRARYANGAGDVWDDPPWSAAFISFVMRSAGVDAREFPPSASHSSYVDAMIRDAREFPDRAPFIPHDPAERAPETGDMICADRSRHPIADWRERAADAGRFRPMHCDIVVATGPGRVETIGGNLRDAVTRVTLPVDASGRLVLVPGANPRIFAIFENRLGRLPPWRPAPPLSQGTPIS